MNFFSILDPRFSILVADSFPRGPGFYFSLPQLLVLLLLYFIWVGTCSWVDQDARALKLAAGNWNLLLLASGLFGLLAAWLLPSFLLTLLVLAGLYAGSSLAYVRRRNRCVGPARRVLTERHLKELVRRYFKIKLPEKPRPPEKTEVQVRLIRRDAGPPAAGADARPRVERTRNFQAAQELVQEAVEHRATEVRLEPAREKTAVRRRVDGILETSEPFSRPVGEGVIRVFKVLANLDLAEKRKPQNGTCAAQVDQRTIDLRVSTAGSIAGEKLVLRLLDRTQQPRGLTRLGMREPLQARVRQILSNPPGLLLVAGPEDTGKSTTLYACLGEIDRFQQHIVTVEDPVEYRLSGVTQLEINPRAGQTLATEVRAALREEPDVLLIGALRDRETAELACQAVQAGGLVLAALAADDAVAALERLLELGAAPAALAGSLRAVLGQRLVRTLCPRCRVRYKPRAEVLRKVNLPAEKIKYFCRPPEPEDPAGAEGAKVCAFCGGTGYHGRTGLFELLTVTDAVRELLRADFNPSAVKQEAVKGGMRHLQEEGLRLVIEGTTSVQELVRVTPAPGADAVAAGGDDTGG
jgi:type II secretory ATPase GspE/PulE/Tfp pilus assembly ATPase PilB-like protein